MEYFVLNEHSLIITNDYKIIDSCLVLFFNVYKEAVKNNFKQIRISENINTNMYEIDLGNGNNIRKWINAQTNKDYSIRLKSLISSTSTPLFQVNDSNLKDRHAYSEFKYNQINVPCLGATFLLNQISISLNSDESWNKSSFNIECQELKGDDIITTIVNVKNVTSVEHWNFHYKIIQNELFESIENIPNRVLFLQEQFNSILFTNIALKQINSSSIDFFRETINILAELDKKIKLLLNDDTLNYHNLIRSCELTISDESDSVKTNPKYSSKRKFMFNNERLFFCYHVKNLSSFRRLHFIIYNNQFIVGYVGKHLPTKDFPK